MQNSECPLCLAACEPLPFENGRYLECPRCALRFLSGEHRLSEGEERERYLLHSDNLNDPGYRKYLMPLFQAITERVSAESVGLDFGSGRAPVLGCMLEEKGFHISHYDPFFAPDPEALNRTYDFVFAAEVCEHFFRPNREFEILRRLTRVGGILGVMTKLYDGVDFPNWYYRRDPTHVSFFCRRTFEWIAENSGWSSVTFINSKTVVLG